MWVRWPAAGRQEDVAFFCCVNRNQISVSTWRDTRDQVWMERQYLLADHTTKKGFSLQWPFVKKQRRALSYKGLFRKHSCIQQFISTFMLGCCDTSPCSGVIPLLSDQDILLNDAIWTNSLRWMEAWKICRAMSYFFKLCSKSGENVQKTW